MRFEYLMRLLCRFTTQYTGQAAEAKVLGRAGGATGAGAGVSVGRLDLMPHVRGHVVEAGDDLQPRMSLMHDYIRRFLLYTLQGM